MKVLSFVVLVGILGVAAASGGRQASWWFAADSQSEAEGAVSFIKANAGTAVTSVMVYCGYSVATNGSVVYKPAGFVCEDTEAGPGFLTNVTRLGVKVEVVLNTEQSETAAPFRALFANASPAIAFLVSEAKRLNLYGWNLDLEPTTSLPSDAKLYAAFLGKLKPALEAVGTRTTIDVADWAPMLNNFPVLAASGVKLMDMETYNGKSEIQWLGWYNHIVSASVPRADVAVGVGTWVDSSTNNTWATTRESGVYRVTKALNDNVTELAMFRILPSMGWPEAWWPELIASFVSGTAPH